MTVERLKQAESKEQGKISGDYCAEFVDFIKQYYQTNKTIALHEPCFIGNEKKYLVDTIDSTFVSSVGEYVDHFETMCADFTGAKYAVATVNGTAALHIALQLVNVGMGEEVITQPLSFIATCNAITYCGAMPVFIDVDRTTMGLSPTKLAEWLALNGEKSDRGCINRQSGKIIRACLPMHTFGHPVDIEPIMEVCDSYGIVVVEDAAEAIGSQYKSKHAGTFGRASILSFNGNKTITSGGGGMLLTNDEQLAKRAKYLTTTAKVGHQWDYYHNELGFNYRMPNLNAALGCAQMEQLPVILQAKRELAQLYEAFFSNKHITFLTEPDNTLSNYWLNAVIVSDKQERDEFLNRTNHAGVATRPIWRLINSLPMYQHCQTGNLDNASWLADRVINIPSGARLPQSAYDS